MKQIYIMIFLELDCDNITDPGILASVFLILLSFVFVFSFFSGGFGKKEEYPKILCNENPTEKLCPQYYEVSAKYLLS